MAVEIFPSVLHAKFTGCLVGALMGDCFGHEVVFFFCRDGKDEDDEKFDFESPIKKNRLNAYFKFLTHGDPSKILRFTDDAYMTNAVASSLVKKGKMDTRDMAKKFVDDFFKQPGRGYGTHVREVFIALRESNFKDVYSPAKLQFDGMGSYGNGAAMRISPIALYGYNKEDAYILDAAFECSRITHTHPDGINGAILQCLAVRAAFKLDSSQALDPVNFIDNLLRKMEDIETKDGGKPYCESLKKMKEIYLQNRDESISVEEIVEILGNGSDISALKSVPSAIFSFLRCTKPIQDFETSNPFMRTIYFALSLGGDTDTIGSMAGSIAGAYYGVDLIPEVFQKKCESIDEVIKLAGQLFKVTQKGKWF